MEQLFKPVERRQSIRRGQTFAYGQKQFYIIIGYTRYNINDIGQGTTTDISRLTTPPYIPFYW